MILLEDDTGKAMHCIRPYRKKLLGYAFDEIVGLSASPLIFRAEEETGEI